jgi:hypothetical protein
MVCSPRPSEPKASQQACIGSSPCCARQQRVAARGQAVVEVADQLGQLARRHALRQQLRAKRRMSAAACFSSATLSAPSIAAPSCAATAAAARTGHARRRCRRRGRLGDGHMAHAFARHQQRRVVRTLRLDVERVHRRAHHVGDRHVQAALRQHHAVEHVVAGQDAQRRAVGRR